MDTTQLRIIKENAWLVVGLAALWPALHATPYYPMTLLARFASLSIQELSLRHIAFSFGLAAACALAWAFRNRCPKSGRHVHACLIGIGVVGLVGNAAMACGVADISPALECLFLVAIAFAIVFTFIALVSFASLLKPSASALCLVCSYCLYSFIWILVKTALLSAESFFICIAPLASGVALCLHWRRVSSEEQGVDFDESSCGGSWRTLPLPILGLGCAFVYFGVIIVRVFTVMGQDAVSAGQLDALPYSMTAVAALVLALGMALAFAMRGFSFTVALGVFALLSLAYLAALLIVMVAQGGFMILLGKRAMVAAEHCLEVYLTVVLAASVRARGLSSKAALPVFFVVVFVVPQVISLDVLLQTGLLGALVGRNLVLPIAAVGVFGISVAVVVMLIRSVTRATQAASMNNDTWQRELCSRALAGFECTSRELEVVLLTYRGLSAKKIAEELLVSESTVKSHQRHVYRKLGVHSKQDLIAIIDSFKNN